MPDTNSEQVTVLADENGAPQPVGSNDRLINRMVRQIGHMKDYSQIYLEKGLVVLTPSNWGNLNNPRVQAGIRETAGYVIEEMMEAINLLKNKPWRQDARQTDPDEFYGELADAWHFWLELMIICGMTPDMIAKYYFGKAEINDQRKAEGY